MPDIKINFIGKDQVSPVMKSIGGGFGKMGKAVAGVGLAAGAAVGGGLIAAGAGLAAFAAKGTKNAIELEQQLANIRSVATGSEKDIAKFGDLILDLGMDPGLKVDTFQAADAIELLARNGLDARSILDGAAKSTVQLANATGADFGGAADVATDVMALFGIEAKKMDTAVDGITSVVNNSKFSFDDYRLALANVGGVAAGFGVEFDDMNTTLAATASAFAGGSDAGTSMKVFLQRLASPTGKALELMTELGLATEEGRSLFYKTSGEMEDMATITGLLERSLGGLSEAKRSDAVTTLFGADAARTALALTRTGKEAFDKLAETMAQTKASENVEIRMNTLAGAMEVLGGTVEAVGIRIGQALMPAIKVIVEAIQNFVSNNADTFIAFFERAAQWIGEMLPVAINFLVGIWQNTLVPAFTALGPILQFLSDLWQKTLLPAIKAVGDFFVQNIVPILTAIGGLLGSFLTGQVSIFAGLWSNVLQPAIAAIFPVFQILFNWLSVNLPIAIQGIREAWETVFLPAVMRFFEWVNANLIPLLMDLSLWLQENLPIALQALSEFWVNVLLPAISQVWAFLTNTLLPILGEVVLWLLTNIPVALGFLADTWTGVLQPALAAVYTFIAQTLIPVLGEIITWLAKNIPPAIGMLVSAFTTVLLPALAIFWNYVTSELVPLFGVVWRWFSVTLPNAVSVFVGWITALKDTASNMIGVIVGGFESIRAGISGALDFLVEKFEAIKTAFTNFKNLVASLLTPFKSLGQTLESIAKSIAKVIEKVSGFNVPPLIRPGSPTPFEMGLRGIADAMQSINNEIKPFNEGLGSAGSTTNNNQQMNLTINSSAPTENIAADFNMMKASIAPV